MGRQRQAGNEGSKRPTANAKACGVGVSSIHRARNRFIRPAINAACFVEETANPKLAPEHPRGRSIPGPPPTRGPLRRNGCRPHQANLPGNLLIQEQGRCLERLHVRSRLYAFPALGYFAPAPKSAAVSPELAPARRPRC